MATRNKMSRNLMIVTLVVSNNKHSSVMKKYFVIDKTCVEVTYIYISIQCPNITEIRLSVFIITNSNEYLGDDGWNVQEQAKISDNEVKGIGVGNEPRWENEALIANLDPYTYYALYVKAIVIQDTDSINNNTGAESDIIYFRTYADYPTKPVNVMLASSVSNIR